MDIILQAVLALADPIVILLIFGGVSAGLFVGAMPGLTATSSAAGAGAGSSVRRRRAGRSRRRVWFIGPHYQWRDPRDLKW